jgi:hypothetical protein
MFQVLVKLEFLAMRRTKPVNRLTKVVGDLPFSYLATRVRNFISMSNNKPLSGIKAPDNRQRYHGSPPSRRIMANTMTTAVVHLSVIACNAPAFS